MSLIKVDTIVNSTNTGSVSLEKGGTIPAGKELSVTGNINVTGILTATSFTGDGSQLTGLGGSPTTKAVSIAWGMLFGNYHRA